MVVAVMAACLNGLVLGEKVLRVAVVFNVPDVVQSIAWDVFKERYNDRSVNGDKLIINDTKYFVWPSHAAATADSWRSPQRWQTKLEYIAFSRDDQNRSVEPYHLLVHPMAEKNGIQIGSKLMQAASIPNVHAGCADESDFKSSNDYTFGTSLPDIWFPRDPIRLAKVRGLVSMMVVVTRWVDNFRRIAHAALGWALKEDLSTIGPSSQWCRRWANTTEFCRIVGTTCHCGKDSMMPKDLPYSVTQIKTFYEFNEFNCGYTPDAVDSCTARYVGHIIKDAFAQGSEPDIFFDWTVVFRDVLYGVFLASYNPKMYGGYLQDGIPNWAIDETGLVNSTHGWWAFVTGQWHRAMRFTDLTFGNSWEALRLLNQRLPEQQQNNARAVEVLAVGSVLNVAIEKHMDEAQLDGQPLQSQRNAIRSAMTDLNDETLWGHVRFNRHNQNIGRGLASWQIIPDVSVEPFLPQDKSVLPSEFAEMEAVIPAPTWESRFGCRAGTRNTGAKCEQCEIGKSKSTRGTGVVISECSLCESGRGASGTGFSVCMACEPGRKHDGTLGYCVDCERGTYINTSGSTSCRFCPPGKFQNGTNPRTCSDCIAGTYRGPIDDHCLECSAGAFGAQAGQEECEHCGIGFYADEKARTQCTSCDGVLAGSTTQLLSAENASFCVCPEGQYKGARRDVCLQCPSYMTCALGAREEDFALNRTESSNFPLVIAGYYTESDNPLKVYKCASIQACPGGMPGSCAPNMERLSCGACARNYYMSGSLCHPCGIPWALPVWGTILFIALGLCMYMWSARSAYFEAVESALASVTVGSTIGFIQSLGTFERLGIEWPQQFKDILDIAEVFLIDIGMFRRTCILVEDVTTSYVTPILTPIAALGMVWLWHVLGIAIKKIKRGAVVSYFTFDITASVSLLLVLTFYVSLVVAVSRIVECVKQPGGGRTLRTIPYEVCFTRRHWIHIGIGLFFVLLFVIAPIAWVVYAIIRAPHDAVHAWFRVRYKPLFFKFRPRTFWFTLPTMMRSLAMACVTVVSPDDVYVQFLTILFILVIALAVQQYYTPYSDRWANCLEGAELGILIFILGLGSWFNQDDVHDSGRSRTVAWLLICSVVICAVMLCSVFVYACYLVWKPGYADAKQRREVESILPNLRNLGRIFGDLEDERLTELITHGTYVDVWHMKELISYVALEIAEAQQQHLWQQRLPSIATSVTGDRSTLVLGMVANTIKNSRSGLTNATSTASFSSFSGSIVARSDQFRTRSYEFSDKPGAAYNDSVVSI